MVNDIDRTTDFSVPLPLHFHLIPGGSSARYRPDVCDDAACKKLWKRGIDPRCLSELSRRLVAAMRPGFAMKHDLLMSLSGTEDDNVTAVVYRAKKSIEPWGWTIVGGKTGRRERGVYALVKIHPEEAL
jgi:hypothetical protein